jgi:hypothetical protein
LVASCRPRSHCRYGIPVLARTRVRFPLNCLPERPYSTAGRRAIISNRIPGNAKGLCVRSGLLDTPACDDSWCQQAERSGPFNGVRRSFRGRGQGPWWLALSRRSSRGQGALALQYKMAGCMPRFDHCAAFRVAGLTRRWPSQASMFRSRWRLRRTICRAPENPSTPSPWSCDNARDTVSSVSPR